MKRREDIEIEEATNSESITPPYQADSGEAQEVCNDTTDTKKVRSHRKIKILTNIQAIPLATIIFLAIIFFIDDNNIIYKRALTNILKDRIRERDSLVQEIEKDSIIINRLKNDNRYLERYAREHFYYRNIDEDVYLIDVEILEEDTTENKQITNRQ